MNDPDHVQIVFKQIRDYNQRGRTIQEACDLIARFTPAGVLAEARERYRRSVNAFQVGDKVLCRDGWIGTIEAVCTTPRRFGVRVAPGRVVLVLPLKWYDGFELAFAE